MRIEERLQKVLRLALKKLNIRNATAAVFLVPGQDLKRFKSRYDKKPILREVDVLAFGEPRHFPHPESKKKFLGEIYVNKKEAADFGHLQLLLIHGLLHLAGYSHGKKRDTLKMESLERKLIERISQ